MQVRRSLLLSQNESECTSTLLFGFSAGILPSSSAAPSKLVAINGAMTESGRMLLQLLGFSARILEFSIGISPQRSMNGAETESVGTLIQLLGFSAGILSSPSWVALLKSVMQTLYSTNNQVSQ